MTTETIPHGLCKVLKIAVNSPISITPAIRETDLSPEAPPTSPCQQFSKCGPAAAVSSQNLLGRQILRLFPGLSGSETLGASVD